VSDPGLLLYAHRPQGSKDLGREIALFVGDRRAPAPRESPDAFGLILGLASAAALLYLSVSLSEMVLLGFGTVGLFVFVLHLIDEYLADGLGGPLALLIAGIALLLVALMAVRLKDRAKSLGGSIPRPGVKQSGGSSPRGQGCDRQGR